LPTNDPPSISQNALSSSNPDNIQALSVLFRYLRNAGALQPHEQIKRETLMRQTRLHGAGDKN
jgi:hypothetical protein